MESRDFEFYRDLLARRSGLIIGPDKTYLLESRLGPVARKWEFEDVVAMTRKLRERHDEKLIVDIVEAMTTNETSFFRDIKPFQLLERVVMPQLLEDKADKKHIRIWCGACSSGQEPYSIAMSLREMGSRLNGWNIEIVATDISNQILNNAREGVYTQFEVQRGLPVTHLIKYFEKEGDKWRIKQEIRDMIGFKFHNLLEPARSLGVFDVVFCRNVLIYFNEDIKKLVLANISQVIPPDGYLFLGGAETVLGLCDDFVLKEGERGLYTKKGTLARVATA